MEEKKQEELRWFTPQGLSSPGSMNEWPKTVVRLQKDYYPANAVEALKRAGKAVAQEFQMELQDFWARLNSRSNFRKPLRIQMAAACRKVVSARNKRFFGCRGVQKPWERVLPGRKNYLKVEQPAIRLSRDLVPAASRTFSCMMQKGKFDLSF